MNLLSLKKYNDWAISRNESSIADDKQENQGQYNIRSAI